MFAGRVTDVIDAEILSEEPDPPFKFFHLRYHFMDNNYNCITDCNPTGYWNLGGATIVTQRFSNRLRYTFAICSRGDNFCRRTGRELGKARIKQGIFKELPIIEGQDLNGLFNRFIKPVFYERTNLRASWKKDFKDEIAAGWVDEDISNHLW